MDGVESHPSGEETTAARRIAEGIRHGAGRRSGWCEVRVLMETFRVTRLSPNACERMTVALDDAGVSLDRELAKLGRGDILLLSLKEVADTNDEAHEIPTLRESRALVEQLVEATVWTPGEAHHEIVSLDDLTSAAIGDEQFLWLNVRDGRALLPQQLCQAFGEICPGLTTELARALLEPDPRPTVQRHGSEIGFASAFIVRAEESDLGVDAESLTSAGVVTFEPIGFLVSRGWLITCWHETEVYRGASRVHEGDPAPPGSLVAQIDARWRDGAFRTPSDLAVILLFLLSLSYRPAVRALGGWLEDWEIRFYKRGGMVESDTLYELRALSGILRRWIDPMNRSGMRADISRAWFPHITDEHPEKGARALAVDEIDNKRVDKALDDLSAFGDRLRSTFDLLQIRLGEEDRARDEEFQRGIAVGGAVILIPTLVAAVEGSNTWIPGHGSVVGFAILLVVLIASGLSAWFGITMLQRRQRALR